MREIDNFFAWVKDADWKVSMAADEKQFPDEILKRYTNIPIEYKLFYEQIDLCSNPDDTCWVLTKSDFLETDGDSFAWNTFEKISLEAADDDADWIAGIKDYWDSHLPIMLLVGGEYEYYAIDVSDASVVHGYEPEFEESSKVADSFSDFLNKIVTGEIKI